MITPTAIVDYSRPVGWWCPVCGETVAVNVGPYGAPPQRFCANVLSGSVFCFRSVIPRYLPIPEGQRPLVDDEVGEAEVVTAAALGRSIYWGPIVNDFRQRRHTYNPTAEEIRFIVTGATE